MGIKDETYEALFEHEGWMGLEDIVERVREEYAGASALDVRQSLNEFREEGFVERGKDLKFREKR